MVSENKLTADSENVIDAVISAIAELSSRLSAIEEALNETN